MGRKKDRRRNRRNGERRERDRDDRRENREADEQAFTPMGMPDAPIPDAPVPDATPPDARPSVGLPAMENVNPIPQTDRVPMASRGYGHEAQEHIMRATDGTETDPHDVPDAVLDVLATGSGQSLDASLQRALEDRMDADFSNVEIHTGPEAAKAADAIDARAFTCGNAIVFNDGEYDPESAEGQYLLAHELAHVKQQTGAAISMMPQADADLEIDPDPQLEREADQAAEDALSGEEPLTVNRLGTDVHVQRVSENKVFEAMALFEAENESGEISDFREDQNENRLAYLHGVAQDVIEKQQKESSLGTKQELKASNSREVRDLAKRGPSEADIKTQIEQLKSNIDADLSDVALTEDQRRLLDGDIEVGMWDKVSWGIVKGILSVTTIPYLIKAAKLGTAAAGKDLDDRGRQTVAQLRDGKISDLDDLKHLWEQTNGSLEDRAEQIEQEIREGVWYDEDGDPYQTGGNQ
ncbi:hypothetical protein Halru_3150 [Halovivax ruber XH-70]|uniref:eCIS core domain-containing protein n=1 Tax=Halovivax ruber (strain DSM 18193 / JCM 13892 / XH-70) TaxID=797302 RepID=L0IHJ7_HALRX|nr:DUF4157 domain-containing protein [Halovivax ruber]AGB17716.1 hypothetical protein Halru_3150 [Halovivax ruber XH-70]